MAISTNDLHGPTHLDLDPKPPNSVRLSKRAGILALAIVGGVGFLLFYGIATRSDRQFKLGFQPDDARSVTAATDVGKTIASRVSARPASDARESLTASEEPEDLSPPPLTYHPGQTSPAIVTAPINPPPAPIQYPPQGPPPQESPEDRRRALALQRELEAMEAPTAAREVSNRTASASPALPTTQGDMSRMTQLLQALQGSAAGGSARAAAGSGGALPHISLGGQGVSGAEEYKIQNSQDEKEEFFEQARARNQETYLNRTRVRAPGPYEIKAGWDIPAVLEQALNSDLPGEVKALVRENVYDTATGKYLLIPQGSRLVGNYSSRVSYGQNGVQVAWDRIILPDGSSIVLDNMPGLDVKGMTGVRDKVDSHFGRLLGMGALTSLFAAAGQLAVNRRSNVLSYPSPQELAGQSAAQNMTQIGAEAARRNLYVQPTIKVAIGYRFNVRVHRDLLFDAPYKPY